VKVRNFSKLQHFKDRSPPWIKLYRDILDQRDINLISDCSFRVLVGLWLLASEDKRGEGNLPCVEDIAFRLRMEKSKIIRALSELNSFLIHDDISLISERYQLDAPETETETEVEKETEKEKPQAASRASRSSGVSRPDDCDEQTWADWSAHRKAKKATITQTVVNGIRREAIAAGIDFQTALKTICENNWVSFKAEYLLNKRAQLRPIATKSGRTEQAFDEFLGADTRTIDSTAQWAQP
jgi:hypothetical protein